MGWEMESLYTPTPPPAANSSPSLQAIAKRQQMKTELHDQSSFPTDVSRTVE